MIILDGGMSREIQRVGGALRQPEWSAIALMETPDAVRTAHENYIAAGADVITTNAYACVPHHLGDEQFAERGRELAELAARLAREAVDGSDRVVRVAASIPPLFGSYKPGQFDAAEAPKLWPDVIEPQLPYVDILQGETLSSIEEVSVMLEMALPHGKPVWVSATLLDEGGGLRSGESVKDFVEAVLAKDSDHLVEAILFNCSAPEVMADAVAEAKAALGDREILLGVYANAFEDKATDDDSNVKIHDMREDLTPDIYVRFAETWKEKGAGIIGGCCGIGPDTISKLSAALRG